MSQAVVADFPVPVAPSSTTSCSPAVSRRSSSSIAAGWSPAGWCGLTTSNRPPVRGISPTGRCSEWASGNTRSPSACPASWCTRPRCPGSLSRMPRTQGTSAHRQFRAGRCGSDRADAPAEDRDLRRPRPRQRRQQGLRPDRSTQYRDTPFGLYMSRRDGGPPQRPLDAVVAAARARAWPSPTSRGTRGTSATRTSTSTSARSSGDGDRWRLTDLYLDIVLRTGRGRRGGRRRRVRGGRRRAACSTRARPSTRCTARYARRRRARRPRPRPGRLARGPRHRPDLGGRPGLTPRPAGQLRSVVLLGGRRRRVGPHRHVRDECRLVGRRSVRPRRPRTSWWSTSPAWGGAGRHGAGGGGPLAGRGGRRRRGGPGAGAAGRRGRASSPGWTRQRWSRSGWWSSSEGGGGGRDGGHVRDRCGLADVGDRGDAAEGTDGQHGGGRRGARPGRPARLADHRVDRGQLHRLGQLVVQGAQLTAHPVHIDSSSDSLVGAMPVASRSRSAHQRPPCP